MEEMFEEEDCVNGDCTGQPIWQMQPGHPLGNWCIECGIARTCVQGAISTYSINRYLGQMEYEILGLRYDETNELLFFVTTAKVDNEWLEICELVVATLEIYPSLGVQLRAKS